MEMKKLYTKNYKVLKETRRQITYVFIDLSVDISKMLYCHTVESVESLINSSDIFHRSEKS